MRRPDRAELAVTLVRLTEQLAAVEHERWAHWQRYVHGQAVRQSDGSLVLPAALVMRWERQMATEYTELTEQEKESDRDQVRKYLPLIEALLEKVAGTNDDGPPAAPKPRP